MVHGLVPTVVLLGGGKTFRKWGLVGGPQVLGDVPLEDCETTLSSSFLFSGS
jgi:hypothetical protein